MTAFLHGQSKFFFQKKKEDIQRTNILRLSNPKASSKGKRYLLTSYNVNDVTERAPHDPEGEISLSYMDKLMMDCFSPTFPRFWLEHQKFKKREKFNFSLIEMDVNTIGVLVKF